MAKDYLKKAHCTASYHQNYYGGDLKNKNYYYVGNQIVYDSEMVHMFQKSPHVADMHASTTSPGLMDSTSRKMT
jgi:hypothetical protein